MKAKPIVTVIVTTFNRKELLQKTIESILDQKFKDFELIVVDNFSDYDFFSFMRSFGDDRISAFQNQNNGIIAVNRNYGIIKAKGDYIAFCDDDDLWVPNKLNLQLKYFSDDIIGVGSSLMYIDNRNKKKITKKHVIRDYKLGFKELITFLSIPLSSLIVENDGFLFNEQRSFVNIEDLDFQLNAVQKTGKRLKLLSEPLVHYRIHTNSGSYNFKNSYNFIDIYNKYSDSITDDMQKVFYHRHYYSLAKRYLAVKRNTEARECFYKSFNYSSFKGKKLRSLLGYLYTSVIILIRKS